jgi:invasion protein IalB
MAIPIRHRAPWARFLFRTDAAVWRHLSSASFVAVMLCAVSPASAADAWEVTCKEGSCTLARVVVEAAASGRRVATVLLVPDATGRARLAVALPLGVALAPGVRLVGQDVTTDLAFEVCYPDGCRAAADLDAAALAVIAALPSIELRAFPFGAERPLAMVIPLDGLAEALARARATLNP